MDLEIDEFSGCPLLFEPGAESNQRHMVDDDVLSRKQTPSSRPAHLGSQSCSSGIASPGNAGKTNRSPRTDTHTILCLQKRAPKAAQESLALYYETEVLLMPD